MRMLFKSSGTEGKLVTNKGPLYTYDVAGNTSSVFAIYMPSSTQMKNTACSSLSGMGVWHIASKCDDCTKSCSSDCSDLTGNALNNCAKKWCKDNDPNNDNCVKTCGGVDIDKKSLTCASDFKDKCATYKKDGKQTIKEATKKDCEQDQENNVKKYEFNTKSCYEDKTKYTLSESKYYVIECTEKQVIDNLPVPTKITAEHKTINVLSNGKYVNREALTYSVYAGMSISYEKTCNLSYLHKNGTDKTTKYGDSYAKKKITDTNNQITEDKKQLEKAKKARDKITDTKSDAYKNANNKVIAIQEAIKEEEAFVNELKKVKDNATKDLQERLKGNKDYTHLIDKDGNGVEIDPSDSEDSNYKTDVVFSKMKPVSCKKTNFDNTYVKCTTNKYGDGKVVCEPTTNYTYTSSSITGGTYKISSDLSIEDSYFGFFTNGDTKIYHTKEACEAAVKPTNGYCKVISNAYVVENDSTVNFVKSGNVYKKIKYKITLNGTGDCGQFKFDMTCPVEIMKKQVCDKDLTIATATEQKEYKDNCECIAYCGSNVACREKYCPNPCPECNTPKDDICNNCESECDDKYVETSDNIVCKKDCCNLKCNGNKSCLNKCCTTFCKIKYGNDSAKYKNCVKTECGNGTTGEDYYYRTINPDNPFPKRKPGEQGLGENWINKENFITKDNSDEHLYYDKTNGRSKDEYEYKVVITKDGIKNLRSTFRTNTSYVSKARAKNYTTSKSLDGNKVYCSKFIHETVGIGNVGKYEGVQITTKGKDYGMGCVK